MAWLRQFLTSLLLSILAHASSLACAGDRPGAEPPASPLSAEQSLAHLHLADGLHLELAAAEPDVIDPVAARFDEDGRLWVVEMRDYPNGPAEGQRPLSRIRLLEDRDGDGRFETSGIFADGLPFATGVQPWDGGAIVSLSGEIIFLKDTTGDGMADRRELWFTGFAEENPQLRANHPRFALNNRVYVANGLRGGSITSATRPQDGPVAISGRDFRFDPLDGRGDAVSGHGQFGLTFDDFGNRFNTSNRNPLMHAVLEERYLARNPLLAVPAVTSDVVASGEASQVFPLSEAWTTSILHAGQFTAACGSEIYRGDALPSEFLGNVFICEPTGNLVHREVLRAAGATFAATPADEGVEFLASTDAWFRPVNLEVGPDGCLYVVDMYRAVIEHPEWVPDELKQRPDLRHGDDRGRIYRIVPAGFRRLQVAPRLSGATSAELAEALAHRNAWWRETAARLLYQRQDKSVVPALEDLVQGGTSPQARAHALWALAGLGALTEQNLLAALGDAHPRVLEQAVQLAELRLATSSALRRRIVDLALHDDARLRFQVALTLGELPLEEKSEPLVSIALSDADDLWTRRAIATSAHQQPGALLAAIARTWSSGMPGSSVAGRLLLARELAELVGAGREADDVSALFRILGELPPGEQTDQLGLAITHGLALGIERRGTRLTDFFAERSGVAAPAIAFVDQVFAQAAEAAGDAQLDMALRIEACRLLEHAHFSIAGPVLAALIAADGPQELRLAAIRSLAPHGDSRVGPTLVAALERQTPAVRRAVLEALSVNPGRAAILLDEIAAGRVGSFELNPVQTGRLREHADAVIHARAAKLLAGALPADREAALAEYQAALALQADAARGEEVFRKNCAACHKIGDIGVDVAPSIADARTKTPEQLLVDIMQPNRAIDNDDLSYSIALADGTSLVGLIVSETAASVTLKQPEGKTVSLLRSDIDEIRSNGVSLMPDGLERSIPLQDMADLISFIKNWRYLDEQIPVRAELQSQPGR